MDEKALEAAAQELAAWIGYAYEGLQDRDISAEFSDWCYNGIGDRGMQGGKPAVRKACQRIVSSYLAAAPGEYKGLVEEARTAQAYYRDKEGLPFDAAKWGRFADAIATLSAKLAAAEARADDAEDRAETLVSVLDGESLARQAALAREAKMREALTGLLAEWDKFTRYGSPMAKNANERIMAARATLAQGGDRQNAGGENV